MKFLKMIHRLKVKGAFVSDIFFLKAIVSTAGHLFSPFCSFKLVIYENPKAMKENRENFSLVAE